MTKENQTVMGASIVSRTTKEIYREIEAAKAALEASLAESKSTYEPPTGSWDRCPAMWMARHNWRSGESKRRSERRKLRLKIKRLRAEWDNVAFEASRSINQPVCQKHQQIVASALSQFTVDAHVDGIFSHNNTHAARKVLRALNAAGYKIVKVRAH